MISSLRKRVHLQWDWPLPSYPRGRRFIIRLYGHNWMGNTSRLWRRRRSPDRRLVLVTGEGSHQLTAQEISQFGRRGLKPIVFVLNNSGYLIERLLCKDPNIEYNDLAQWHYADLPKALGCDDWFTAR